MSVFLMTIIIGAVLGILAYRRWNKNRKRPVT